MRVLFLMPLLVLVVLADFSRPAPVRAASFDCKKAATWIETTICGDTELSELDRLLGIGYEALRHDLGKRAAVCLKEDQRRWLAVVRGKCKNAACLRAAYLARLSEWAALLPGAAFRNDLDYPEVPALVLILPPAPESQGRTRALARKDSESAKIEGVLVDGEGSFNLRTADGTVHNLAPGYALDERRIWKIRDMILGNTVIVSGPHGTTARGDPAFDPHACRFINQKF